MIKDTKEGQTHFYNDGCGDPEHNTEKYLEKSKCCNGIKFNTDNGSVCKKCMKPFEAHVTGMKNKELNRIDIFIIREVGGKLTKRQIQNIRRLFENVY